MTSGKSLLLAYNRTILKNKDGIKLKDIYCLNVLTDSKNIEVELFSLRDFCINQEFSNSKRASY